MFYFRLQTAELSSILEEKIEGDDEGGVEEREENDKEKEEGTTDRPLVDTQEKLAKIVMLIWGSDSDEDEEKDEKSD